MDTRSIVHTTHCIYTVFFYFPNFNTHVHCLFLQNRILILYFRHILAQNLPLKSVRNSTLFPSLPRRQWFSFTEASAHVYKQSGAGRPHMAEGQPWPLALVSHTCDPHPPRPASHPRSLQQCQLNPISACQLPPRGRRHGAEVTMTPSHSLLKMESVRCRNMSCCTVPQRKTSDLFSMKYVDEDNFCKRHDSTQN